MTLLRLLTGIASLSLLVGTSFGQGIQLSPAQQQMLNSLPPAQREQALSALRDLQSQGTRESGQTINERPEMDSAASEYDFPPALSVDAEPRAMARSRMVIDFALKDSLLPEEARAVRDDVALQQIIGTHHFKLDDAGTLSLDGLPDIPLLGLSESDVERRLEAEPALSVFTIDARILSQLPTGVEALEPFGYSVFEPKDATFDAPATGPVPADYVLGPGDTVRVQLFGNVNGIYEYEVSRDGILNLPEIGPVTVAGIPFSEFRADINKRVKEMLIGTQVSVTMGPLRTIRVFVLGDANEPGSYIVSGLATISSALYRSGGISDVGSLRRIQLKRNGRVIANLDLYDLLISGDTSGDRRLLPGDVIFIPPVGKTVAVAGALKRPAIYEILDEASVGEVVRLAGGLSNEAFAGGARIERIGVDGERSVIAVDLDDPRAAAVPVRSGDSLLVPEVLPDFENAIELAGHVYRPGTYAWRPGMRLSNVITSVAELKPGVDMNYVVVRRQIARGEDIEVLSANLAAALANPGGADDIALRSRDQVNVLSLDVGRQRTLAPIIEELRRQSTHYRPARQVQIDGNVRAPGTYPLEAGMTVRDLIRAGGSLAEEAYALSAELTRYRVTDGDNRTVESRVVDLAAVMRGDESANISLAPYDYLRINRKPDWDTTWTVTLEGEVRFPGRYRVRRGESLGEVLSRAGGLTDDAFAEGAVFLRESLRNREQEQIELLARRLESDLTTLSLQLAESGGSDTLSTGQALLDQLRNTEPVGRLVIDTRHLATSENQADDDRIELRNGDRLLVPKRSQVVTVIGEAQQNTSHLYLSERSRDDYINLSGGLTRRADTKRIYVVRANGEVIARNESRWLGRGRNVDIRPGDTIVIPLDADKMRPLTFWTNVTQILYQGAIAIAAIRTFDN